MNILCFTGHTRQPLEATADRTLLCRMIVPPACRRCICVTATCCASRSNAIILSRQIHTDKPGRHRGLPLQALEHAALSTTAHTTYTNRHAGFTAELPNTPTAEALWDALPLQAQANRWGDELYFSVPFQVPLEADARAIVQAGDVAYWPDGPALCFFFGPTPVSRPGEIRAASAVNVCGTIRGDSTVLRRLPTERWFY